MPLLGQIGFKKEIKLSNRTFIDNELFDRHIDHKN